MKKNQWKFLALALASAATTQTYAYNSYMQTKFGTLSVSESRLLHFNGQLVAPGVMGNSGLSIEQTFDVGSKVLVLTKNVGGSGCPELFNVITIDKSKATASPTFGTCDEAQKVQALNQSLVLELDGKQGYRKYVFADGVLTENGKVLPDGFSSKPFGSYAVINDPDGYTNLRQGPNGKSPIIGRVDRGDFFRTHPQTGDWWQVQVRHDLSGYMHKSRIVMIRDF